MAQQLIVEGNDSIVIANLLRKRKLLPPLGYSEPVKFRDEFIKNAGGFNKIPKAVEEALDNPALNNIGIIVDANEEGATKRLAFIRSKIEEKITINQSVTIGGGAILKSDGLSIGIWIMPDNENNGYLEHFLASLIPQGDPVLTFAQKQVEELKQSSLQKFSEAKKQKALLHTWLAWQKEPGKPFGQAAELGYFDLDSINLLNLEEWFKGTFVLTQP